MNFLLKSEKNPQKRRFIKWTNLFNICVILCRCFKERNVEWVCILFCRGIINYFFRCLLINWLNSVNKVLIFTISHLFPTKSLFTDSDAYLSISWSHCLTLLKESWSILRNNLEHVRNVLYKFTNFSFILKVVEKT